MAHQNTIKHNNYKKLTGRLNLMPQGAVASDLLFEILKILFSEREAGLVSSLPVKPFSARKAAGIWKMSEPDTQRKLNDLADRGILIDACENDDVLYSLPPPMAAVLGVILKLPPLKQALASQQFKSRYLVSLIRRQKYS
jgi:hypothetical protein